MLLGGVEQAAGELHGILAREAPEFACFWRDVIAECRALLAAEFFAPEALDDFAQAIVRAFGVGMGSLSDLVLSREDRTEMKRVNAHLGMLRCKLGALAERLRDEARSGARSVNPLAVRRHLVELETVLIEERRAGRHRDEAPAVTCRALLNGDDLDCHQVLAFVDETQAPAWWNRETYARIVRVLNAIRRELSAYLVGAEGSA